MINKNINGKEIAIIGVSLRFPKSNSLDEFWNNILSEKSFITEVPSNRWNKENFIDNSKIEEKKTKGFWGGFIDDADCFDASFFNISPREAMFMDPQQRISLELAWAAIEDAGYKASDFKGSKTGVFMGVCNSDYTEIIEKYVEEIDAYIPTGTSNAIVSNRISYWFDFNGPSITLDTACASSLVAIHQAVRSLENEDCEYALAGGVNLCWTPRRFLALRRGGMLSKSGKCSAFDENADGYTRGEGGAIIVLKPLKKAIEDCDNIYGVIKGVGTNHGGRTNSLTITNPKAHTSLLTEVYKRAGITPDTVTYIETHGPGTPLGDPIEIHGLKTAFSQLYKDSHKTMKESICGLGSVKTNIGHLESAAGIAGVIKVIASMKNKILPACVNFNKLNPIINFNESPFYIVNKTKTWDAIAVDNGECLPRRAGVSSFGFGGVNAHVILEEYIAEEKSGLNSIDERNINTPILIPFSAKNQQRLKEYVKVFSEYLKEIQYYKIEANRVGISELKDYEKIKGINLLNIAYTLQVGREEMNERVIFLAKDIEEFIEQLEAFYRHEDTIANCLKGQVKSPKAISEELKKFIMNEEVNRVAEYWIDGYSFDWALLYKDYKPQRISLPTYPFAKERHWIPEVNREADLTTTEGTQLIKPNTSEIQYKSTEKNKPLIELTPINEIMKLIKVKQEAITTNETIKVSLKSLQEELKTSLAKVLYIQQNDVDINKKFIEVGLDSIIAVEWIQEINKKYGVSITAANVYDYPTIYEFSEFLRSELKNYKSDSSPNYEAKGISLRSVFNTTLLEKSKSLIKLTSTYEAIELNQAKQESLNEMKREVINTTNEIMKVSLKSLQEELKTSLAKVLYIKQEDVDIDKKFIEMGLDSIISVEWIQEINKKYEISITATNVYDYPTIYEFSKFLQNELTEKNYISSSSKEHESVGISLRPVSEMAALLDKTAEKSKALIKLTPINKSVKSIEVKQEASNEMKQEDINTTNETIKVSLKSLQEELKTSLAKVLYIKQEDVDIDKKFIEMGLDSIIAVEWIKEINKKYGISITTANVYDYPNSYEFSKFLQEALNKNEKELIQISLESKSSFSLDDILENVYKGTLNIEKAEKILYRFIK